MHIDNLDRINKLVAELKLWREVEQRSDVGIFKTAQLVVTDATHGAQGIPMQDGSGSMQNGQTIVRLEAKDVQPIARAHIERITGKLAELGVST